MVRNLEFGYTQRIRSHFEFMNFLVTFCVWAIICLQLYSVSECELHQPSRGVFLTTILFGHTDYSLRIINVWPLIVNLTVQPLRGYVHTNHSNDLTTISRYYGNNMITMFMREFKSVHVLCMAQIVDVQQCSVMR